MFRRFARHVRDGFLGVGRHFGMALSSASAVTITLLLIALFLVSSSNLLMITKTIEESISISVLIEEEAESQHLQLENKIMKLPGVLNVEYRTKDEEFDYYLSTTNDVEVNEFYESYREDNPFKDCILVEISDGTQISNITTSVLKMDGVDSVHDGGTNTYLLVNILGKVRMVGGAMVAALCVLAVYLVYNTIKITISSRKDEIWIMRNVGARNGYIRAPFLVEGIIIGFMGAIIPILIAVFGYIYVFDYFNGTLFGAFNLIAPFPYVYYLAAVLAITSIIVGFVGSYISVVKYLRYKRWWNALVLYF